jgi:hypothetical protein
MNNQNSLTEQLINLVDRVDNDYINIENSTKRVIQDIEEIYITVKNLAETNSSINRDYVYEEMMKCKDKYNQILQNKNCVETYLDMIDDIIDRNTERENTIKEGGRKKSAKKKSTKTPMKKSAKKTTKKSAKKTTKKSAKKH